MVLKTLWWVGAMNIAKAVLEHACIVKVGGIKDMVVVFIDIAAAV